MDHRASLQQAMTSKKTDMISYQDMVDFKLDLCKSVAPFASAVLLDPIYGVGQVIASGSLLGSTGLLVSVEKTGYSGGPEARITELLPNWNVRKVKRLGASAVKLLLYFRPDLKEIASRQLNLVARLAEQCLGEDIPLLVESVSYATFKEEKQPEEFSKKKTELVVEAARLLTALPIDILKSEFPVDMNYEKDERKIIEACEQLNRASQLPLVLLSAGVSFTLFKRQVEIACRTGASGFMAGRALWNEATKISSREERMKFFQTTVVGRLQQLSAIANRYGKPWYSKIGARNSWPEVVPRDWYKRY
jgi:tagatose 1,6-diphosphate aldolase